MHIGKVARNTGMSVDTIRFYERRGLLARLPRSAGGFRVYSAGDLQTLEFIQRMNGLGFSLKEVSQLAALRTSGSHACSSVRALLAGKLHIIRKRVRELQVLEQTLRSSLQNCQRELKKKRAATTPCPVLEGLCTARRRQR